MASPREKVRPTTAPSRPNRENTRPASPKTPKTGHFCRAGRTISRFPIRITPQGELFRAYPTRNEQSTRTTGLARTHETTCNYPPHPNREKTRPTTAPWHPRAKKFAQQQPTHGQTETKLAQQQPTHGQTETKLAQQAQKHRKPAIFAEQGEKYHAFQPTSNHRANIVSLRQLPTSVSHARVDGRSLSAHQDHRLSSTG